MPTAVKAAMAAMAISAAIKPYSIAVTPSLSPIRRPMLHRGTSTGGVVPVSAVVREVSCSLAARSPQ